MRRDKFRAIELRKAGKSYNEIVRELGVPKSTLSSWFQGIRYSNLVTQQNIQESKRIWATSISAYNKRRSQLAIYKQAQVSNQAKVDIEKHSIHDLLLVGTALYWAEGYKQSRWSIVFTNTDESMVQLMMEYFRVICKISLSKIRGQVQVHSIERAAEAAKHWSQVSGIPLNQFRKPLCQIPKSSKRKIRRRLSNGTFRIIINDVNIVSRIRGWILGMKEKF